MCYLRDTAVATKISFSCSAGLFITIIDTNIKIHTNIKLIVENTHDFLHILQHIKTSIRAIYAPLTKL